MLFRINPSSSVGLADQIAGQVRGALASGQIEAGTKLPAARDVAAGLDVNMHTVLRAYSQLRDEGLIELRRGRGAVVRADAYVGAAALDQQIRELLDAANRLGLNAEELVVEIRRLSS